MSCGSPHGTPCGEVIEQVYLYLDGELDEEKCAQIRHHLDECSPCLKEYGVEDAVKSVVRRSCSCEPAPHDVRQRLMTRLSEIRIEIAAQELG